MKFSKKQQDMAKEHNKEIDDKWKIEKRWIYIGIDKVIEGSNVPDPQNLEESYITGSIPEDKAWELVQLLEKTAQRFLTKNKLY